MYVINVTFSTTIFHGIFAVIRRRGASPKTSPMSASKDTVPRPRLSNQGVVLRSKDQTELSTQSNTQMLRPKTAQQLTRKSLRPPQKRYLL